MEVNKIYHGDVYRVLLDFPDKFFNSLVTSPPYYALRDYNLPKSQWPEVDFKLFGFTITIPAMECCLGLEDTPEAFIGHMVLIFREARRTLRDDGTLWVNIGDSYWGGKGKSGQSYSPEYQNERYNKGRSFNGAHHQIAGKNQTRPLDQKHPEYKPKDLCGIPWMLAFALRSDGWYLRSDIIWNKPNPMPESVYDRPTKSHEYIFMFSKSPKYYYDHEAIRETRTSDEDAKGFRGGSYTKNLIDNDTMGDRKAVGNKKIKVPAGWDTGLGSHGAFHKDGRSDKVEYRSGNKARKDRPDAPEDTGKNQKGSVPWEGYTRNKRSVWTVAPRPFQGAHFATFPEKLITPCILAGCPENGVVLDIFMGAGTTALVSRKLGRNYVGIDLNKNYIDDIANPRLDKELGMFK